MKNKIDWTQINGIKIISLDPGKSTGITYWNYELRNLYLLKAEVLKNYLEYNWNKLKIFDLIIIEDFLLYPSKAQKLYFNKFPAVKVIGIVEYFAHKYKKKIVFQRAIEAKKMIGDNILRKFNCYTTSPHTRDSARHAIAYFLKRYKGDFRINNITI